MDRISGTCHSGKLKRAIAREIFKLLTRVVEIDDYSDLRPTRRAKSLTLTAAAGHFGESGRSRSHAWNAASNATTPSPTPTANGSPPPLDNN